ncbi:fungal-specific transcription factor domain-containing protein [Dactylonectria macrodidyma]|uniref:Fungal-specific transcription factor domain-containing protein n=1 Tax=Dactylonectria macrodidyma TaxID=307937 RepID=A0A9P9INN7_9HYPO|nr:fungal-specific transcription factor domain-containing protein [Dactylonectria macrodidyma]
MSSSVGERQKRRKIALACEPCRERKARCDGGKPVCSTCQRRSLGLEQCIYKAGNVRTASSDEYTKSLHDRIRELEQACSVQSSSSEAPQPTSTTLPPQMTHTELRPRIQPHQNVNEGPTRPLVEGPSPSVAAASDVSEGRRGPTNVQASLAHDQADGEEVDVPGISAMGTIVSEDDLSGSSSAMHDFFGSSSAASFLKEAADSMGSHPPNISKPASDPASNKSAFSTYANFDKFTLPPRPLADHLLQRYFARVYYLYPFFDRLAFEEAYASLWQPSHTTNPQATDSSRLGLGSSPGAGANTIVFHCALNSIFALGCTFSDLNAAEKATAIEAFFTRAKSFVGLDLLDSNNMGVVQALLIVALVLQGMPVPHRCWNSVGVACRVAQGLGLHIDRVSCPGGIREREARRRTWNGCVVLDMLVSMTLGRPTMTTNVTLFSATEPMNCPLPSQSESERLKLQFSTETMRLNTVLERILSEIYQPWLTRDCGGEASPSPRSKIPYNFDTIMEIHQQLNDFEKSVSPFISWTCPTSLDTLPAEDRSILEIQRNVLHARVLYLQLMLFRPMLTKISIANGSMRQPSKEVSSTWAQSFNGRLGSSFALECAKECVDAGTQLISLVYSTHKTNTTGAWWWNGLYACSGALVIILARLCPSLWNSLDPEEMATAWTKCQGILNDQATFSISSRKSLDLLLKFNDHVLKKISASEPEIHHEPGGEEDGQRGGPQQEQELPYDALDMSFPLASLIEGPDDAYMMGFLFSNEDPTMDFLPTF